MNVHPLKLVVMVGEAALEKSLCADVKRLGARGYTVVDARGAGRSGERGASWDEDRSIRMEVLCDDATATAIMEHVSRSYFEHYAMTVYLTDIGVLRPDKFGPR